MEEALIHSRAHLFAKDEDIKMCQADIVYNAAAPVLVEAALQRENGSFLTDTGALSVRSGAKTGRSPKDKRLVAEPQSKDNVWWCAHRLGTRLPTKGKHTPPDRAHLSPPLAAHRPVLERQGPGEHRDEL